MRARIRRRARRALLVRRVRWHQNALADREREFLGRMIGDPGVTEWAAVERERKRLNRARLALLLHDTREGA